MAEMTEQIKVSSYVKEKLEEIKEKEKHSTMDSVIRTLIHDREAYLMLKQ